MQSVKAPSLTLSELNDSKLLALSRHWGRVGLVALRRFLATLPKILKRGLFRRCRCASIFEYAAKFSGATREVVSDVLAVHARIGAFGVLWTLLGEGRVGLTVLRRIARHITADNAAWWADKVQTCTVKEIEALLRGTSPAYGEPQPFGLGPANQAGSKATLKIAPPGQMVLPTTIAVPGKVLPAHAPEMVRLTPLAAQILENLLQDYSRRGQRVSKSELLELVLRQISIRGELLKPDSQPADTMQVKAEPEAVRRSSASRVRLPRVLVEVADVGITFLRTVGGLIPLMPREASAIDSGKPTLAFPELLAKATEAGLRSTGRTPPAVVKLAIAIRSAGRCEVGSCDRPLEEIDHVAPYSETQVHDPARMVGLCGTCHRAKHNGLILNPDDPPEQWRLIELGGARRLTRVDRKVQQVRLRSRLAMGDAS